MRTGTHSETNPRKEKRIDIGAWGVVQKRPKTGTRTHKHQFHNKKKNKKPLNTRRREKQKKGDSQGRKWKNLRIKEKQARTQKKKVLISTETRIQN